MGEVKKRPELRFRWFPICRPRGIELLDARHVPPQSFQAFLRGDTLPFYSRRYHLELHFSSTQPNEAQLIGKIDSRNPGLIISGAGGLGHSSVD